MSFFSAALCQSPRASQEDRVTGCVFLAWKVGRDIVEQRAIADEGGISTAQICSEETKNLPLA